VPLAGAESGTELLRELLAYAIKSDRMECGNYVMERTSLIYYFCVECIAELVVTPIAEGYLDSWRHPSLVHSTYIEPLIVVSRWPRHPSKVKLVAVKDRQSDDQIRQRMACRQRL
jgi:hypothetical protein